MPALTTDWGEQWWADNALNGVTITVGLFNQTTDGLGETSDTGDITSKPNGASYSDQTDTVTTKDLSGNYGYENDSTITFDTSDSTNTVDHAFIAATVAGSTHLVAIAPLNDSRDLNDFSEITIEPGLLTHKAD